MPYARTPRSRNHRPQTGTAAARQNDQGADLRWSRTLAAPSPRKFREQIKGQEIREVTRRAKYFILRLSDFSLLIHLRMSGDLFIKRVQSNQKNTTVLLIKLSGNRSLVFNDTRKFGRVWLTSDPRRCLANWVPNPRRESFTPQWLHAALQKKHRQLKPLLLDQTFLAGLGNIYTDEALHIAKLHPLARSDSVTAKQARGVA
jgi:formamidopyrimidine-DNA glycosylase